jgi:hypothetical protein
MRAKTFESERHPRLKKMGKLSVGTALSIVYRRKLIILIQQFKGDKPIKKKRKSKASTSAREASEEAEEGERLEFQCHSINY